MGRTMECQSAPREMRGDACFSRVCVYICTPTAAAASAVVGAPAEPSSSSASTPPSSLRRMGRSGRRVHASATCRTRASGAAVSGGGGVGGGGGSGAEGAPAGVVAASKKRSPRESRTAGSRCVTGETRVQRCVLMMRRRRCDRSFPLGRSMQYSGLRLHDDAR